jgi:hypothetical protein
MFERCGRELRMTTVQDGLPVIIAKVPRECMRDFVPASAQASAESELATLLEGRCD